MLRAYEDASETLEQFKEKFEALRLEVAEALKRQPDDYAADTLGEMHDAVADSVAAAEAEIESLRERAEEYYEEHVSRGRVMYGMFGAA